MVHDDTYTQTITWSSKEGYMNIDTTLLALHSGVDTHIIVYSCQCAGSMEHAILPCVATLVLSHTDNIVTGLIQRVHLFIHLPRQMNRFVCEVDDFCCMHKGNSRWHRDNPVWPCTPRCGAIAHI
jgi:hypothetical protein